MIHNVISFPVATLQRPELCDSVCICAGISSVQEVCYFQFNLAAEGAV
jgi:hypothetical protein